MHFAHSQPISMLKTRIYGRICLTRNPKNRGRDVGLCFFEFAATEPLLPDAPPRFRQGGGGVGRGPRGRARGAGRPRRKTADAPWRVRVAVRSSWQTGTREGAGGSGFGVGEIKPHPVSTANSRGGGSVDAAPPLQAPLAPGLARQLLLRSLLHSLTPQK